jgi:hypothetical protein
MQLNILKKNNHVVDYSIICIISFDVFKLFFSLSSIEFSFDLDENSDTEDENNIERDSLSDVDDNQNKEQKEAQSCESTEQRQAVVRTQEQETGDSFSESSTNMTQLTDFQKHPSTTFKAFENAPVMKSRQELQQQQQQQQQEQEQTTDPTLQQMYCQ